MTSCGGTAAPASHAGSPCCTMTAVARAHAQPDGRRRLAAGLALALSFAACQSPTAELSGLAERPPLDLAVLVTGGAYLERAAGTGTFGADAGDEVAAGAMATEPVAVDELLAVLRQGRVFQRVELDADGHRARAREQLRAGRTDPELLGFLQTARDQGYDLLLVVEGLQDSPIDAQGINGRWPVTLATWLLLGVGVFIPDHTFESGVTLRVSLRDLQTGATLADSIATAGPVDLSLVERSDTVGLLTSILVPPFWVGDDPVRVAEAVRDVSRRRLLLSLARELKSEPMRQRLRAAAVAFASLEEPRTVVIDSRESLSAVRLRVPGAELDVAVVAEFEQRLLSSLRREGSRFRYAAELPAVIGNGAVQVLASTLTGNVVSGSFAVGAAAK